MGRKQLDKTRMQIKIDIELKSILDKMNINKSALINHLLYKELVLQNFSSPITYPQTPNSNSPAQITSFLTRVTKKVYTLPRRSGCIAGAGRHRRIGDTSSDLLVDQQR